MNVSVSSRYGVLFFVALLLLLPLTVPLGVVRGLVDQFYPVERGGHTGEIALYDYHGTLVNGGARLITYQNYVIGGVVWRFMPLSLFEGRALWEVELAGRKEVRVSAQAGTNLFGHILINSLDLELSIRKLAVLLGRESLSLDGMLKAQLHEVDLDYGGSQFNVMGKVEVNDLLIGAVDPVRLGSFVAQLKPEQEGSKVVIHHREKGVVGVNMVVEVKPTGDYRLGGTAEAGKNAGALVKTMLAWGGERKGNGKFEIVQKDNIWKIIPPEFK